jgi:hypothetical protein
MPNNYVLQWQDLSIRSLTNAQIKKNGISATMPKEKRLIEILEEMLVQLKKDPFIEKKEMGEATKKIAKPKREPELEEV